MRILANIFLPLIFYVRKNNPKFAIRSVHGKGMVCVSLTSFPARIKRVHLVIETLLRQREKPDSICLWLSKDQFFSEENLPNRLLALKSRGLEIYLCEGDLKSHKKYYYAVKKFPEDILVLADDDIFYPSTFLSELRACAKKFPTYVVGRYTKKIQRNSETGKLSPYMHWPVYNGEDCNDDLFFGSGGGVLIPAGALFEQMLSPDLFLGICPFADDIWLNAMCRCTGTKVVSVPKRFILLPVLNIKNNALTHVNNGRGMNDIQLTNVAAFCWDVFRINPW